MVREMERMILYQVIVVLQAVVLIYFIVLPVLFS